MKIFLIGMPGSGKSTLGRQLATELNLPFVDLDFEIEMQEGKTIKEIFSQPGEAAFRLAESKALKHFSLLNKSFVLATGGGAPCFHEGINIINQVGVSVFLDVSIDELASRVEQNTDRPLFHTLEKSELIDKLTSIRDSRLKCYQQATITVVNPSLQKVLERIKKLDLQ